MRNYLSKLKSSKGFTLIELLVVIGILGILAAALLATIDPFEQLNKAQDASIKNTMVEFVDANVRYYATRQALPWSEDLAGLAGNVSLAADVTGCELKAVDISAGGATVATLIPCMGALVDINEMKGSATTISNILNQIVILGTSTDVTACFAPKSKADKNATDVTWTKSASADTVNCPNKNPAVTCYWCSR
jgi:prepilin-type N-terminal cleavage/methylation domain-containing protein